MLSFHRLPNGSGGGQQADNYGSDTGGQHALCIAPVRLAFGTNLLYLGLETLLFGHREASSWLLLFAGLLTMCLPLWCGWRRDFRVCS